LIIADSLTSQYGMYGAREGTSREKKII